MSINKQIRSEILRQGSTLSIPECQEIILKKEDTYAEWEALQGLENSYLSFFDRIGKIIIAREKKKRFYHPTIFQLQEDGVISKNIIGKPIPAMPAFYSTAYRTMKKLYAKTLLNEIKRVGLVSSYNFIQATNIGLQAILSGEVDEDSEAIYVPYDKDKRVRFFHAYRDYKTLHVFLDGVDGFNCIGNDHRAKENTAIFLPPHPAGIIGFTPIRDGIIEYLPPKK